jgi:hypothetical protein
MVYYMYGGNLRTSIFGHSLVAMVGPGKTYYPSLKNLRIGQARITQGCGAMMVLSRFSQLG